MKEEQQTNEGFFSDSRNIAKLSTGTILLGVFGFAAFVYLLPLLLTIVWGTVELIVGGTLLASLIYILTSKGTWRRLGYINAKIAKLLTIFIINWDEFLIQEAAIEQAKKDRDVIREQGDILFGQVATKNNELQEAYQKRDEAQGMVKELQSEGREASDLELQLAANEFLRNKDFIESVEPLRDQMDQLGKLCQKIYKDTGLKIRDAEAELALQRAKLESLTAGETAMNKAMSIFTTENPDVKLAERLIKEKIGKKIGSIRNTLDIINPIMNERALKDKVKLKAVLSQLQVVSIEADNNKEKVSLNINANGIKETKYNNLF